MEKDRNTSEKNLFAIDDSLHHLVDISGSLLGASSSVVYLQPSNNLPQRAEKRYGNANPSATQQIIEQAVNKRVLRDNTPLTISDVKNAPLFSANNFSDTTGCAACLGYPITNAMGQPVGSLMVLTADLREWSAHELKLVHVLTTVASQSIGLESARLENNELRIEQARFRYAISHDLKSPVNTLHMLTSEMRTMWDENEIQGPDEFLGQLKQTVDRMSTMIEDTLEYSLLTIRPDAAKETVSLENTLAESLTHFSDELAECQGTVTSHDLPTLEIHRNLMVRVFQHLLSNSIRYRDPGRPLVISVSDESDPEVSFHTIVFSDNGIGIEAEHLDTVFSMYTRLHTRDKHDGTGLGLTVCRQIIHQHQGLIKVESVPGSGTLVIIDLPRGLPCQLV